MSGLERLAAQELLAKADRLGAPVDPEAREAINRIVHSNAPNGGALLWADQHGDEQEIPCCYGTASSRASDCTCWTPVFTSEQQPAQTITLDDIVAAPDLCGDCAFRPGSPERSTAYERETLYALADRGEPFWCHRGMRRPDQWQHPDGRSIAGSTDDWQPLIEQHIPYQADGTPALLCAGWAKRRATTLQREDQP